MHSIGCETNTDILEGLFTNRVGDALKSCFRGFIFIFFFSKYGGVEILGKLGNEFDQRIHLLHKIWGKTKGYPKIYGG